MANATISVGDTFTTQRSGDSVKALEVVENKNGSLRVFVEDTKSGEKRWTTVR